MKDKIIIMGSAPCLEADLEAIQNHDEYDFMAIGLDCADRYLGDIQHMATYHTNEIKKFRERRQKAGGNLDYISHGHNENGNPDRLWPYFPPSGSSTMLGIEAALGMGYKKIIVAGVLLTDKNYKRFQEGWKVRLERIKENVRAMNGFPLLLLGLPTEEWLNA